MVLGAYCCRAGQQRLPWLARRGAGRPVDVLLEERDPEFVATVDSTLWDRNHRRHRARGDRVVGPGRLTVGAGLGGDVGPVPTDLQPVARCCGVSSHAMKFITVAVLAGVIVLSALGGDAPLAVAFRAADDPDRGGSSASGELAVVMGGSGTPRTCGEVSRVELGIHQLPPHSMPTLPWMSGTAGSAAVGGVRVGAPVVTAFPAGE